MEGRAQPAISRPLQLIEAIISQIRAKDMHAFLFYYYRYLLRHWKIIPEKYIKYLMVSMKNNSQLPRKALPYFPPDC